MDNMRCQIDSFISSMSRRRLEQEETPGGTPEEQTTKGPWKTFYVFVAGQTNNTHKKIVKTLKNSGQSESVSPEDCDYCVVFCPVVSRLESDVSSALNNSPAGKPIILVVMHYTFNPEYIFIQSRRSVENPNVHLTVDSLFYKDQLLKCNTNDEASSKILRFLGLEDGSKKIFNFKSVWTLGKTQTTPITH